MPTEFESGIVPGQADLVDEAGSEHRTGARFKSRFLVDPQSTCGISSFKQGIYVLGLCVYIYIYMCVCFPFRKCVFMGCKWMQGCLMLFQFNVIWGYLPTLRPPTIVLYFSTNCKQ